MEKKRCIFHIPNHIDLNGSSGSNVRPMKMLKAFQEIGYDVDYIMGYGKERKQKINKIKENINKGIQYDFMYSESSTMPTLLTEKNHLPLYPNLDFGFMNFCKRHGIKIGLFYRDIQWKFDIYKKNVAWYKKCISIPMYRYDLYKYGKILDKFYLTSPAVSVHLREYPDLLKRMDSLPPGCEKIDITDEKRKIGKCLKIFYVGGVSRIYDMTLFLKVVSRMPDIELVLCCKEKEWKENKDRYKKYLTSNIKIVHEMGEGLEKYYRWTDMCCAFAGKGVYMSMAMPIKVFEYLGHAKPIIGTADTEAGRFIEKNEIGWSVPYDETALRERIELILKSPAEFYAIKENLNKVREKNLWTVRAAKVVRDLASK